MTEIIHGSGYHTIKQIDIIDDFDAFNYESSLSSKKM